LGETRCEQLVGALSGGSTVLSFFGVGFGGGETAIRIMAVGEVVNVLTGYGGLVLVMTGNERGFTVSVVSGTIVTNLWASRLVWQRLQVWTPVLPPWPRTRLAQH